MTFQFRHCIGTTILLTSLSLAGLPHAWAEDDPDVPLQVIELPEDESVEDIPPPQTSSQRVDGASGDARRPIDEIIPDPAADTAAGSAGDDRKTDAEPEQPQQLDADARSDVESSAAIVAARDDINNEADDSDRNSNEEDRDLASGDDLVADEEMQENTDSSGQGTETTDADPEVRRLPETVVVAETRPAQAQTFRLLSGEVLPGTTARLAWSPDIQIAGLSQPTPVLVVNGTQPGPVMCMTAAVHGDELNGIEIIRRIVYNLKPRELSGTVVGVPIVNLQGFQQGSRYLADRRDLNRYFPGSPDGSLAHRIAHSLFEQVISHCDMLVDIHTGSLKRTNLPQLRANMNDPDVAEFSRGFDSMVVVHSPGSSGMLRSAAGDIGIPAVTMEVGESMRIQEDQIEAGVNSITSLLERQRMTTSLFQWGKPEPVYYNSHWVRTNHGGILFSNVSLGAYVTEGTVLGRVSDPITNEQFPIRADADGRIIGMAVDQVVMAGFAAYHVGSRAQTPEED